MREKSHLEEHPSLGTTSFWLVEPFLLQLPPSDIRAAQVWNLRFWCLEAPFSGGITKGKSGQAKWPLISYIIYYGKSSSDISDIVKLSQILTWKCGSSQKRDVQDGHVWPIWHPWPFAQFFKMVTSLNQTCVDALVRRGSLERRGWSLHPYRRVLFSLHPLKRSRWYVQLGQDDGEWEAYILRFDFCLVRVFQVSCFPFRCSCSSPPESTCPWRFDAWCVNSGHQHAWALPGHAHQALLRRSLRVQLPRLLPLSWKEVDGKVLKNGGSTHVVWLWCCWCFLTFFLLESREGIAGRLHSEIALRPRSFCRSWWQMWHASNLLQ